MRANQQYKRLEKRFWKIAEKLRLRNSEAESSRLAIAELHKDRIRLEKQVQELLKTKGGVTQRQVKEIINAYKREKEALKC